MKSVLHDARSSELLTMARAMTKFNVSIVPRMITGIEWTYRPSRLRDTPAGSQFSVVLRSHLTMTESQRRQTPCKLSVPICCCIRCSTDHPMYLFRVNIAAIGIVLLIALLKSAAFSFASGA